MNDQGAGIRREDTPAARLLAEIKRAARPGRNEEDFKIAVEQALAPIRTELEITPRYETTYPATVSVLGGGSSDAVYGHLVIEYKRPGRLATVPGQREATEELQRYLFAEAGRYGAAWEPALRRMIGVALDGESILFLRYRGERQSGLPTQRELPVQQLSFFELDDEAPPGFQRLGPLPVTYESINQLLIYIRALRRRALTPEALAAEFGPYGDVARALVQAFYSHLVTATTAEAPSRAKTFFREWDRIFGIVYGQDVRKAERDAAELGRLYGMSGEQSLKPLLFAVHTYYAALMKLLAAELASLQSGALVASPLAGMATATSRQLRASLQDMEEGGLFARLGIHNFLEGDFFGWYLDAWGDDIEVPIRQLARGLTDFEPATGTILPEATRDLLKKLYQYLIPTRLRHDLGEYYTPDWLAELLLDESKYTGDLTRRFLDPSCGSGTFLVLAIRRAREWAEDQLWDPERTARAILANVVGFDLNPLAVIAARTNYLLALGTLIRRVHPVEIPVYLCDSVLTPASQAGGNLEQQQAFYDDFEIPSTVGPFNIPRSIVSHGRLPELTTILDECVRTGYTREEFLARIDRELNTPLDEHARVTLGLLFDKLDALERANEDGLWARLVKNAFAPVFAGRFEFVIGNPPWVRWGYLSDEYRRATAPLWDRYGLFSLHGMAARLGGGEKDFSMLFTYVAADRYLQDGGTLGFLITQEVLKGKGAGKGFRRFRLGSDGEYLGVRLAHDLVQVQPFEGAANKTAAIVLTKGQRTDYPIPYTTWRRHAKVGAIPTDATLRTAMDATSRSGELARPIGSDLTDPWQTVSASNPTQFAALGGPAAYTARRGAGTDPYGVFWVKLVGDLSSGQILVENLPELGKKDIEKLTNVPLEHDLLYPAVRGADIVRWYASPEVYVIVAQDPMTRRPHPATEMRVRWPKTYQYLRRFTDVLLARGSNTVRELAERTEPWAMFGIGEYTFAPYRVTWKRMANDLVAAVLSTWHTPFGAKALLPTDTTAFVPVEDETEAHFIAGLLNSTPVRAYVRTFSSAGRGFGAPDILRHIALPRFDPENDTHSRISSLARDAQRMVATRESEPLPMIEAEIDHLVRVLFGMETEILGQVGRTGPLGL